MRHTELPEEVDVNFTVPGIQPLLDRFWDFIEDHYEEEWVVESSGAINLRVDEDMVERILQDNDRHITYPNYFIGLWSITGIYNERQALVDGPRSYYFDPEGF